MKICAGFDNECTYMNVFVQKSQEQVDKRRKVQGYIQNSNLGSAYNEDIVYHLRLDINKK